MFPEKDLTRTDKDRILQKIIDKIVEKSESGKDRLGKSLPKYSKSYKESDEFKAFGKTNKPNMTLTGDMLGQIDILKIQGDTARIGWDSEEENLKAHGNITGQEGIRKKRDFFGLTVDDIKEIISGES